MKNCNVFPEDGSQLGLNIRVFCSLEGETCKLERGHSNTPTPLPRVLHVTAALTDLSFSLGAHRLILRIARLRHGVTTELGVPIDTDYVNKKAKPKSISAFSFDYRSRLTFATTSEHAL